MFKINGTGRHFWIKEGEDTPLLTVGDIVLSGSTFSRTVSYTHLTLPTKA